MNQPSSQPTIHEPSPQPLINHSANHSSSMSQPLPTHHPYQPTNHPPSIQPRSHPFLNPIHPFIHFHYSLTIHSPTINPPSPHPRRGHLAARPAAARRILRRLSAVEWHHRQSRGASEAPAEPPGGWLGRMGMHPLRWLMVDGQRVSGCLNGWLDDVVEWLVDVVE